MKIEKSPLNVWKSIEARVAPPLLLWALGVPGGFCIILWLFFWRGK